MEDAFVVGYARTPIGSFGGKLASMSAPKLGAAAMAAAIERSQVPKDAVQEIIFGHVLTSGCGVSPAKQAALAAGLPDRIPCTLVNKVCASGLKAAALGAQSVKLGDASVVLVGGMESMSKAPFLSHGMRWGTKMGHTEMNDAILSDGLWDGISDRHMGSHAELCAREHAISREDQDKYALQSYHRAQRATADKYFASEIVPVTVDLGRGRTAEVAEDEEPPKLREDKIGQLRPAFEGDGTVTAANASPINDGAAALVLASGAAVSQLSLRPIAKIIASADYGIDPEHFTMAPSYCIEKLLSKTNMSVADIDVFEINEAFAVVAVANARKLGIDESKLNIFGGAVALGHPLGASGARILCTLLSALLHTGGRRGVAAICNGGGGATALMVELVSAQ